jgi:hypothetical protein
MSRGFCYVYPWRSEIYFLVSMFMNQVARMWKGGLTLRIKEIISRVVFTIALEVLLIAV